MSLIRRASEVGQRMKPDETADALSSPNSAGADELTPGGSRRKATPFKSYLAMGIFSKQLSSSRELSRLRDDEAHILSEIQELRAVIEEQIDEQDDIHKIRIKMEDTLNITLRLLHKETPNIQEIKMALEPEILNMKSSFRNEERFGVFLRRTQESILTKLATIELLLKSEGALREKLVGKKGNLESEVMSLQRNMEAEAEARKEFERMNFKLDTQVQILTELRNKEAKEKIKLTEAKAQLEVELDQLRTKYEEEVSVRRDAEKKMITMQMERDDLFEKLRMYQETASSESRLRAEAIKQKNEIETQLDLVQAEAYRLSQSLHQERQLRNASDMTAKKLTKDLTDIKEKTRSAQSTPRMLSASVSERPLSARTVTSTPRPPSSARSTRPHSVRSAVSSSALEVHQRDSPRLVEAPSMKHMWVFDIQVGSYVEIKVPLLENPTYIQNCYSFVVQNKPHLVDLANNMLFKNEEAVRAFREENFAKCIADLEASVLTRSKIWDVKSPEISESWMQVFALCNEFGMRLLEQDKLESIDLSFKLLRKAESIATGFDMTESTAMQYQIYNNMAYHHLKRGKPNSALQYLQKAIRLENQRDPLRQIEMNARMAFSYWAIGNHPLALNHLRIACDLIDLDDYESPDPSDSHDSIITKRTITPSQAKVMILHNLAIELHMLGVHQESLRTAGLVVQLSANLQIPGLIQETVSNMNHIISAISKQNTAKQAPLPRRPQSASTTTGAGTSSVATTMATITTQPSPRDTMSGERGLNYRPRSARV